MDTENSIADNVVTEADADARVVLPYLKALNIQPDQIRAQMTFTVRIGRNSNIRLGGRDTRTGRLDYLIVNADGRPLFVVELKGPREDLTDDDRDQGISYARLLHPMAPLVLVTNARETRLYDTVTRDQIGSPDSAALIQGGGRLSAEEDLRLRFEALQHFVGFNSANIAAFSRAQRETRMRSVRGSGDHHDKKYEPDLYLRRDTIRRSIAAFLKSDRLLFALGGQSGYGKTNEMCSLAEDLGESNLVLFFTGGELHGTLTGTLAAEFEWFFSEGLPLPQLCRRISNLAKSAGRPLLILIDGVDEAPIASLPQELSDLLIQLEQFRGDIRVIVSAKAREWRRFSMLRGVPAPLATLLYSPGQTRAGMDEDDSERSAEELLSHTLDLFSPDERDVAIKRYTDVLHLHGEWTYPMREAVADPFLLRVVAEVAVKTGAIPTDPGELELVRRYVQQKLERTADPDRALRELVAVAKSLAEADENSSWERDPRPMGWTGRAPSIPGILETTVRQEAGVSVTETIANELVSFGLLLRSYDLDGKATLAFAYDRVRDYILATHVFEFERLDPVAFRSAASASFSHGIKSSALLWYLPSVTVAQWHGFTLAAAEQVARLLDTYEAIRAEFSPLIRRHFEPGEGLVGAVFAGAPQRPWFELALFRRPSANSQRVRYDPIAFNVLRGRRDVPIGGVPANLFGHVRGGLGFGFLREPDKFAAELAVTELKRVVSEGLLPELENETLLTERVLALTHTHRRRLGLIERGYSHTQRVADRYSMADLCPLNLGDLHLRIHRQLAIKFYENALQNERLMAERDRVLALPDAERPELVTIQITWTEDLVRPLRQRAEREVAEGRTFFDVPNDPELVLLARAVQLLRSLHEAIEHPPLPTPDVSGGLTSRSFEDGYSDDQLGTFLRELLAHALFAWEQVRMIAFSERVQAIMNVPPRVIAIICMRRDQHELGHGDFLSSIYYGPAVGLDSEAVVSHGAVAVISPLGAPPPVTSIEGDSFAVIVETPQGRYQLNGYTMTELSSVIAPHDAPNFVKYGSHSSERYAPVRAHMYKLATNAVDRLTAGDLLALAR
jgi:hypothetical protein